MKVLGWLVLAVIITAVTWYALAYRAFIVDVSLWAPSAHADDDASYMHAQGHSVYRQWYSQKTGNCCNDQDCHPLKDDEWKEDAEGPSVLIKGQWCRVEQKHYVIRGKSPNWEVPHACVNDRAANMPPCERLLCFMGIPKG